MRTKNSIRNIIVSCISYGIIFVGSFVTRRIFASILGLELVGIDGAFSNVVSALSIVEMGLGVGIVYKLYKPIVEKDWEQVSSILCFLRKFYIVISIALICLGVITSYFVVLPIESFSKAWLIKIFILYVLDVLASYLYSHKRSMLIADQKNYINNLIHILVQVLMFVSQIIVLKIFMSYELYLFCKIICRVLENLWISYRFNKNYKFINLKTKSLLTEIEKKDLFKNIKAMLFHKISAFGATSMSNLIIVYGVNLKESGIYSNYMLIVMAITTVTNEIFNSILASFGNLLNTNNSRDKVYSNFNALYFLNFLIYSFGTSAFVCAITPFIELWTGFGSAFNINTVLFIAGYMYIYGIRQSICMAKVGAGIYDADKYLSIVGVLITLLSSFILVKFMGVSGVMLGNVIGILAVPYWVQSYLVYSMVFRKDVKPYHYKFILYTFLTGAYVYLTYSLCKNWSFLHQIRNKASITLSVCGISQELSTLISQIAINFIVCIIIPNFINVIIFSQTKEFKRLFSSVTSLLKKSK